MTRSNIHITLSNGMKIKCVADSSSAPEQQRYPHLSWFTVAIETDYTNYQHLAKDFKQFSGYTSNSLIIKSNHVPERMLGYADFSHTTQLYTVQ